METRICSQCNEKKPLTNEFFTFLSKVLIKYRANCKVCQHKKQSESYFKNKKKYKGDTARYRAKLKKNNQQLLWNWLLEHPCVNCGETNPVVLDLDHLKDKAYAISRIIFSHPWKTIEKEMAKCQVLCANCHRKKTAKDFNHYRYIENIERYLDR